MANPAAFSPRRLLALSVLLLHHCVSPQSPVLAQQPAFPPAFAFSWSGDKSAFSAGDTAVIMIRAFDLPPGPPPPLSFSVSVRGKKGNSTYLADVVAHIDGDPAGWTITFVPLRTGDFVAEVTEDRVAVGVSTLQFAVAAAGLHPPASPASWKLSAEHVAGTKAAVCVVPRDAFGNAVPRAAETTDDEYFRVAASRADGSPVEFTGFQYSGWTDDGCLGLEFVPIVAGDFLVHVYGDNLELRGSPLQLTVTPGALDMEKSTCSWKHGTNLLQIFSKLEVFIHQKDSFGNLVPEIHPFDVRVVKSALNVSVPVVDLLMEAVADGIQLLSFNVVQPGEFNLTFFGPQQNQRVSNMVCTFDVFVGLCNGSHSFANGSGLAHSVAGSVSSFNVFLQDLYSSPSPIETALLQVRIQNKNRMHNADPIISPLTQPNETIDMDGQYSFNLGPAALQEITAGDSTMHASQFHVSYTPQIAGEYEIWVQSGNIVLNGGNPYAMTVSPGAVSTSLSRVLVFDPKVKISTENAIIVQLVDSFMNPVVSSESKLWLQLRSANIATPVNMASFVAKGFVDNRDGSYTAHYLSRHTGSYNICAQFEQKQLAPCPLEVHVLADEYFSDVKNDHISVWEDESVSFDVLLNDYIAGSKAEILKSSSPLHGSVLQFNHIYRYTPFEGYVGNDSFSYTVLDANNNVFTAIVFIAVLCRPPQFVSLPQNSRVTEDILGPKFGGFPGIEMVHSDKAENISVTVKAQSGSVFLAPMPMKIQQPADYVLSISRGGSADEDLILHGTLEAINDALQFLQYVGNADFYGSDVISLHAMNRNGAHDATFQIFVEPINDPPVILAPETIFLGGNESKQGYHIFDKHRDTFQFAIVEPDLHNFPGNKSHLLLVLSIEVSQGSLMVTLPRGAFATAELKIECAKYWQPLVNMANHFVRKSAIRFRGDIDDCNYAMQHLFYHGPIHGTTLSIAVNDLGNYGCYPDCSEKMSTPLTAMKTIRLVKTRHMNSIRNLWAESVLAIEFMIILCLGAVLLYYFLKCLIALMCEKRDRVNDEMRRPERTPFRQHSQSKDSRYYSTPADVASLGVNSPSFRRRFSRSRNQELELQPVSRSPQSSARPDITTTEERRSSEIRAVSFAKLS